MAVSAGELCLVTELSLQFSGCAERGIHQAYFYLYLNLKVSFYSQSSTKEPSRKCVSCCNNPTFNCK